MTTPALVTVFDLVGGLPVHPLVVHVTVVVLPLAALALLVVMSLPRAPRWVRWSVVAALAVGALSTCVAAESGEALSDRVGEASVHEELGEDLPLIAAITLALSVVWAVTAELASRATANRAPTRASRALLWWRIAISTVAGAAAVVAIWFTVRVGHSGAVATWQERVGG
ncbi:MAG: DUF2231 domain-containing protein [Microcella sp.]|uniref:DUF2231 domain-containing protein n=1 Tax=Microcella sp. TaxID=1913979 RepID=UPI003314DDE0